MCRKSNIHQADLRHILYRLWRGTNNVLHIKVCLQVLQEFYFLESSLKSDVLPQVMSAEAKEGCPHQKNSVGWWWPLVVIVIYRSKGGNINIFFNERTIKCMQRGIWGWCLGKTGTRRSHRRQLLWPQVLTRMKDEWNKLITKNKGSGVPSWVQKSDSSTMLNWLSIVSISKHSITGH